MDTPALRKARGAFFTPTELATFITDWAVRSPSDVVLEPSCGDAAFLLSAARHLQRLGAPPEGLESQLQGVEIHEASADEASARLLAEGFRSRIRMGDFFDERPRDDFFDRADWPACDAVIGNPPYIRYQQFSGEARAKGLLAALAQGVRLTGLASSWAAFTIHAAQFLKPEGRLGLVLPAELLTVNYAAQVRRFLLERFSSVRLVLFEELIFPDVLEEVVLLLAEGSGGASRFEVYQARNLEDLGRIRLDEPSTITGPGDPAPEVGFTPEGDQKWTPALLRADALAAYRSLTEGGKFSTLLDWGETYLGAVTGNNDYFTLTKTRAIELGLEESELLKISPPGSKHLRGLVFSDGAWEHLAKGGKRCYLFAPDPDRPSDSARKYIEMGSKLGVDQGYKCRNRRPWWRVPLVGCPDLFFTYMNHDQPRLTANEAGAQLLNSLYGISLRPDRRSIGRDLLPIASLNSVTLLGAEMVGRAYGGGMLKHEPKEADLLPVPSLATIEAVGEELRCLKPQLAAALGADDISKAVDQVDRIILRRHLRIAEPTIEALRGARSHLFQRRAGRARGDRGDPAGWTSPTEPVAMS